MTKSVCIISFFLIVSFSLSLIAWIIQSVNYLDFISKDGHGFQVYFSFIFDDISPGLLAIPFWIPRLSMSLGITIFFIALIDDFIFILKNKDPSYVKNASPIFKDEI